MDFAKQKTEGESGINDYRSLYSERCPLFCGRGGEASDIFYAALSFSHLRCQLPPGGSLGLSVLFVRCVSVLFAGIVHCTREEKQITPSKRTIAVRLLSGAFPVNYKYGIMSRNAPRLPYGRFVYSQGARYIRTKANVIAEDFKGI